MRFPGGEIDQIAFQVESRHLVADHFFGFRRRFPNRPPDLFKDCLNIHWEARDVLIDVFGCCWIGAHLVASLQNIEGSRCCVFAEKGQHNAVELRGPLQRCKMTHGRQNDELGIGNAARQIFGMFPLDEFIMLALDDHDGHADLRQIVRRIVRLRALDVYKRQRLALAPLVKPVWRDPGAGHVYQPP